MVRERLSKEERKQQIKDIALEVFNSNGYAKTSMDDLATKSGISKGGLYHHYSNKEEIFFDLIMDASRFRSNLVLNYIKLNEDMDREELLINMILDKLLDENPYKTIYSIFLHELAINKDFEKTYEYVTYASKNQFIDFCEENGLKEYIKITDEIFNVFISSIYMGASLLKNECKAEYRNMLKIMITAYLKEKNII